MFVAMFANDPAKCSLIRDEHITTVFVRTYENTRTGTRHFVRVAPSPLSPVGPVDDRLPQTPTFIVTPGFTEAAPAVSAAHQLARALDAYAGQSGLIRWDEPANGWAIEVDR